MCWLHYNPFSSSWPDLFIFYMHLKNKIITMQQRHCLPSFILGVAVFYASLFAKECNYNSVYGPRFPYGKLSTKDLTAVYMRFRLYSQWEVTEGTVQYLEGHELFTFVFHYLYTYLFSCKWCRLVVLGEETEMQPQIHNTMYPKCNNF